LKRINSTTNGLLPLNTSFNQLKQWVAGGAEKQQTLVLTFKFNIISDNFNN
jgi:hypothetical protein